MLDLMRKQAGSWMIKFVLGAIIIVFAFWGVGTFNARRLATAAKVDGSIITFENYRDAYNRLMDQARERFGGQLDEDTLKALNLKQQAINQLVNERLLVNEATRMGLKVTDEELTRAISAVPAFQNNGRFAANQYRRVLEANRLTPEGFEHGQRQAMLIGKLRDMLADTVQVSDSEARRWYDFANAKLSIDFVRFDSGHNTDVTVSDEEVSAFFDQHKDEYRTAPMRRARYLFFDPKQLADQAIVAEDELREYYEDHESEFHQDASVEARHVLIRTTDKDTAEAIEAARQRALEVVKKARAGEDFAALAKKYSEGPTAPKGGDLGRFERKDMVKPFADKAFAMKAGEISDPVKTQFGWHVIKVEQVHPATTRSLEQVAEEIRGKLQSRAAKRLALDAAEAAWEAAYDANDLKPVAESRSLVLHTTGLFDRKGPDQEIIGDKARFAAAAFELKIDDVSNIEELPDGYYIIQVTEEVPSKIPPLAAVADAVRADAKAAKQSETARAAAEDMLAAVRGGEDFAAAAAARGQHVQHSGLFGRQGFIANIGIAREMTEAAFQLSAATPLPEKVFNVDKGWYVVRFAKRQLPEDEGFAAQKDRMIEQLRRQKHQEAVEALLAHLRQSSQIEIKTDML